MLRREGHYSPENSSEYREGRYRPMRREVFPDEEMSPHPVFRRIMDPTKNRIYRRAVGDGEDTEKDLVGSIDSNDDWASSLQAEEKAISKED